MQRDDSRPVGWAPNQCQICRPGTAIFSSSTPPSVTFVLTTWSRSSLVNSPRQSKATPMRSLAEYEVLQTRQRLL